MKPITEEYKKRSNAIIDNLRGREFSPELYPWNVLSSSIPLGKHLYSVECPILLQSTGAEPGLLALKLPSPPNLTG
jgi:hypothetical protein